jgi:queuine/archaeosine tRNA-ribosyltransferase
VSQLKDINCGCPACSDPVLRRYVLDPSGARRSDVRMVHNIYTIMRFLNKISERAWGTAIRRQ